VRGAYAIVSGLVIFLVILANQFIGRGLVSEFLLDVALMLAVDYVALGPLAVKRRVKDGPG